MEVVLASGSPRRRELLRWVYPEYTVLPADIDETPPEGTLPELVGVVTASRKTLHVQKSCPQALIIGADTVVEAGGQLLGKPVDTADAARMLALLSGTEHRVYTGVSLRMGAEERAFTQCTRVWFFSLTPQEIQAYIATGEPMDKAGAYGIQGYGSLLVERIEGDYFNVMGLPLARLKREAQALLKNRE